MEAEVPQKPTARVELARKHVKGKLGTHFGKPVFLRIVKEDWLLELWVKEGKGWRILKIYEIAAMSGEPGPKEAEGDEQAPEGLYAVVPGAMNPHSCYHLSFNIGYPTVMTAASGAQAAISWCTAATVPSVVSP